jgi:TatA/E family protein of Tat protein translocase
MFLREPTHILLIILVLILLFGAKRLPDSARALGRSLRIFKGELKNGKEPESPTELQNPENPSTPNKSE